MTSMSHDPSTAPLVPHQPNNASGAPVTNPDEPAAASHPAFIDVADDVAVSPAVSVGNVTLSLAECIEVLPGTVGTLVDTTLSVDVEGSMIGNGLSLLNDVADVPLGDIASGAVKADASNLLNAPLDTVADLGGATLEDVTDIVDTADICQLLSALTGDAAGSGDAGGGASITDMDVGALLGKVTGIVDDVTDGSAIDLSDVGAIANMDTVTDALDPILDGLCTELNLLDIADVGSLLGDHA